MKLRGTTFFLAIAAFGLVVISVLFLLYHEHKASYSLFPLDSSNVLYEFSDIHEETGNSEIHTFDTSGQDIHFSFTLQNGYTYPYAGMAIKNREKSAVMDLSGYDSILVELTGDINSQVTLYMKSFITGLSSPDNDLSCRYSAVHLKPTPGVSTYSFPLTAFTTPLWWYDINGIKTKDIKSEIDFSKIFRFTIESNDISPRGKLQQIHIKSITLKKDTESLKAIVLLINIFGGLVLLIIGIIRSRNRKSPSINYRPVRLGNHSDEQIDRIIDYIGEAYDNPQLSVKDVASQVGVSPARVSALLTEHSSLPFRQYLIEIRLNEAKRLLLETDRQVTEIALATGFNYPTTLNHIFREREGLSPSAFRKEKKAN